MVENRLKQVIRGFFGTIAALAIGLSAGGCGNRLVQSNTQLKLYLRPYGYPLTDVIARFEREHPEVEVIVDDHSVDNDIDGSAKSVAAALQGGQGPDVIFEPDFLFGDVEKSMRSGVFADLTPFLDTDADYQAEDYEQNVLEAGRCNDGQYLMPLTYSVTYLLTTRTIAEQAGINLENCDTWLGLSREIDRYKKSGGTVKTFDWNGFGGDYPNYLNCSYLDYEQGTVDFSQPEFREAAELYRTIYEEDQVMLQSYDTMSGYTRLSQGKILFATYAYGSLSNLFFCAAAATAAGEEPVLLPIRDCGGKPVAAMSTSVGINANSKNQQNAYEFIKLMLSRENLKTPSFAIDGSIRKSDLEEQFDRIKETLKTGYVDDVPVTELPESYYEEYRKVIRDMEQVNSGGVTVSIRVSEYFQPFYRGEAGFDSCRQSLEEGLRIYLSE